VLVISYFYPPMAIGPSFVMGTLLEQFDPTGLVVFSGNPEKSTTPIDPSKRPPVAVRRFDVPRWWPDTDTEVRILGRKLPLRPRAFGNLLVSIGVTAAALRVLRRPQTRALVVVYPKQHFLLAGLLAAVLARKPLFVYFMDVYVEGLPRGRRIAALIERLVARRASVVFAMSEPHRDHFEKRLRRCGVRNPQVVELPHLHREEPPAEPPRLEGNPAIVFTGAIYDAQADSVRRLVDALDTLESHEAQLHLLTQTSGRELRRWGIEPSARVHVRSVTRAEAQAAQRAADVLFLPMGFEAKGDVVRTASPSKLPEYLAAGRPVLVHAPADSFVARYAREHGFAEVIDDPDPAALRAALLRLTSDSAHTAELARRAATTLRRHEAAEVARIFQRTIAAAVGDVRTEEER
jgi:glycosyltransferase involved in cell wall biosynthesis